MEVGSLGSVWPTRILYVGSLRLKPGWGMHTELSGTLGINLFQFLWMLLSEFNPGAVVWWCFFQTSNGTCFCFWRVCKACRLTWAQGLLYRVYTIMQAGMCAWFFRVFTNDTGHDLWMVLPPQVFTIFHAGMCTQFCCMCTILQADPCPWFCRAHNPPLLCIWHPVAQHTVPLIFYIHSSCLSVWCLYPKKVLSLSGFIWLDWVYLDYLG